MQKPAVVLAAALLFPLCAPKAAAQRTDDRVGMPPVHRDTTSPSREAVFVRRAMRSGVTAAIVATPYVLYLAQTGSADTEKVLVAGSLSYVAAAAWGAARRGSSTCSHGNRLWRATGGALAGMSVPVLWELASDDNYQINDNGTARRGRVTAAGFFLGVPIGAAVALYNCR